MSLANNELTSPRLLLVPIPPPPPLVLSASFYLVLLFHQFIFDPISQSDPDHAVIEAYGVWQEKKLYGKVSMGVVRTTYVIDENGVIEWAKEKVKPETNAEEILAYLG